MQTNLSVTSIKLLHDVLDIKNDNIDAEVSISNGEVRTVTLFTLQNISSIMHSYTKTGECLGGSYFWAKNALIVSDLREETIRSAVNEMVKNGEYTHAFGEKESL